MDSNVFTKEYLESLSYQDLQNLSKAYGIYKRFAKKVSIVKKLIGLRPLEGDGTEIGNENIDPNQLAGNEQILKASSPSKSSLGSRRSTFTVNSAGNKQISKMSPPSKPSPRSRRSTFTVDSPAQLPKGTIPIPEEREETSVPEVDSPQQMNPLSVQKAEPSGDGITSRRSTFTITSAEELPTGLIPEENVEPSQTAPVSAQQNDSLFVEKVKSKGRRGKSKRSKSEEKAPLPKTPPTSHNTSSTEGEKRRSVSEKKLKKNEKYDSGLPTSSVNNPKPATPVTTSSGLIQGNEGRRNSSYRSMEVARPSKTSSTLRKRSANLNLLSAKRVKILSSVSRTPMEMPKLFSNDNFNFLKTPTSQRKTFGTESGRKLGTLPNFKAIHERNFANLESIVDQTKRKAQRALKLFSPVPVKKPSGIPRLTSIIPPGPSGVAFSKKGSEKAPVKKEEAKALITKERNVTERTREKGRLAVTGVRTNKRFELLVKMRNTQTTSKL